MCYRQRLEFFVEEDSLFRRLLSNDGSRFTHFRFRFADSRPQHDDHYGDHGQNGANDDADHLYVQYLCNKIHILIGQRTKMVLGAVALCASSS